MEIKNLCHIKEKDYIFICYNIKFVTQKSLSLIIQLVMLINNGGPINVVIVQWQENMWEIIICDN